MKIYTKTGDTGTTGLFGGKRISKESPRIHALGIIDELNAWMGLLHALHVQHPHPIADFENTIETIQHELFTIGAHVATPYIANTIPDSLPKFSQKTVLWLEERIDLLQADLPPLHHFILPSGTLLATHIHIARAICRRAERSVVAITQQKEYILPEIQQYLNRLSDFLFVLARTVNNAAHVEETPWKTEK